MPLLLSTFPPAQRCASRKYLAIVRLTVEPRQQRFSLAQSHPSIGHPYRRYVPPDPTMPSIKRSAPSTTGFVGSLTADQEKKLQKLWTLLLDAFTSDAADAARPLNPAASGPQEAGAPPHLEVGLHEHAVTCGSGLGKSWLNMVKQESPDALLLRFLRARKWDVPQAFGMLKDALIWRDKEVRIDEEILPRGESWCAKIEKDATAPKTAQKDARDYLEQVRRGKVYFRGTDRAGRPIGYVQSALHRPGMQSLETVEKMVVQTIETARCLFTPGRDESVCVVFDLAGFSLSNMEWTPVKFVIRAFEANYPEFLGTMLIHNAPWIFSGIWKVVSSMLDPVVAAKVNFTNSLADLEKFIPKDNILARFGGGDDWDYEYIEPSADEDAAIAQIDMREKILADRREIAARFFAATRAWIRHVEAGESEEAGVQAQIRKDIVAELRTNYWKLDPYVRTRTNLDRTGVVKPGGAIDPYPER